MPEQMTTTATTTTTTTTTTTSAHQAQPLSFGDVLEELEIRFLANLPDEDRASAERLYQHIEQAHWFYEDFYAGPFSASRSQMEGREQAQLLFPFALPTVGKIMKRRSCTTESTTPMPLGIIDGRSLRHMPATSQPPERPRLVTVCSMLKESVLRVFRTSLRVASGAA